MGSLAPGSSIQVFERSGLAASQQPIYPLPQLPGLFAAAPFFHDEVVRLSRAVCLFSFKAVGKRSFSYGALFPSTDGRERRGVWPQCSTIRLAAGTRLRAGLRGEGLVSVCAPGQAQR